MAVVTVDGLAYLLLANGFAASLQLLVARVAAALSWRRALSIFAVVADGSTAAIGGTTIAMQAVAFVGRHTAAVGAARITFRQAVLATYRVQCVALTAATLVLIVAHAIAAAEWAGGDAFTLNGSHMSWHAYTGIGRRADAIGAVVLANRLAASINMGIALVALAAHLNLAEVRGGAVANILFPRAVQQRGGSIKRKRQRFG